MKWLETSAAKDFRKYDVFFKSTKIYSKSLSSASFLLVDSDLTCYFWNFSQSENISEIKPPFSWNKQLLISGI